MPRKEKRAPRAGRRSQDSKIFRSWQASQRITKARQTTSEKYIIVRVLFKSKKVFGAKSANSRRIHVRIFLQFRYRGKGGPKLYFCQSPNQCTEKHRVYSHKFTLTYLNISASIPPAVFLHDPTPGERREGPDCRESILFTREGVQEAGHGLFLLCCRDSPRSRRRSFYTLRPHEARKNGSGDRPKVTNE